MLAAFDGSAADAAQLKKANVIWKTVSKNVQHIVQMSRSRFQQKMTRFLNLATEDSAMGGIVRRMKVAGELVHIFVFKTVLLAVVGNTLYLTFI